MCDRCRVPTPAEKKALIFLAAVAISGAGVRATGAAGRAQSADAASREALRRQIVAVESAAASDRKRRGGGKVRAADARQARAPYGRGLTPIEGTSGAAEIDPRSIFAPAVVRPSTRGGKKSELSASTPVDVDRATAADLERLPRIGPALAQRIVDDRADRGAFGSLDALQRVRGIGPAMGRELAPYVTFSGTPRPSIAGEAGASAASGRTRKTRVHAGSAPERRKRRPIPP